MNNTNQTTTAAHTPSFLSSALGVLDNVSNVNAGYVRPAAHWPARGKGHWYLSDVNY
jgi:hypothetical protein